MKNNISIVYICDEKYVMPTCVSIQSIYENRKVSVYDIYIIGVDLSQKSKNRIKSIKLSGINIHLLEFENKYKDLNTNHVYVSKAALFKFDIPNILPDLDKVLYLDGDTIVLDDLSELFNTDITEYYAGVINDPSACYVQKDNIRLGIKKYFNSGVMLLNINKLRLEGIPSRLLDCKLHSHSMKYMDNDCFNIVFNDSVCYLEPKFNYFIVNEYLYKKFTEKEITPVIVHFTSSKPWEKYGLNYGCLWDRFYLNSNFGGGAFLVRKYIYKEKQGNKRILHIGCFKFSYKKLSIKSLFKFKPFVKEKEVKEILPLAIKRSEISEKEFKNYPRKDLYYYLFENVFYDKDVITKIQRNYLKYVPVSSVNNFLAIGCGRGAFLNLIQSQNIKAEGIEINKLECELLIKKGFNVKNIDALEYLKTTDKSFSGISMIEVVEHLSFDYLFELLAVAYKKIELGGVIIIETLNPMNIQNLKYFYTDLTHLRPVPLQSIQFLCEFAGFKISKIIYSAPNKKGYVNYAIIAEKY